MLYIKEHVVGGGVTGRGRVDVFGVKLYFGYFG